MADFVPIISKDQSLFYVRIEPDAIPPIKRNRYIDLFSYEDVLLGPTPKIIKTGIEFVFDDLTELQVFQVKELILKGIHRDILEDGNTLIMWTNNEQSIRRGDRICTFSAMEISQTRYWNCKLVDNTDGNQIVFKTYKLNSEGVYVKEHFSS